MRVAQSFLVLGLSIALAGCTPWATYPPVEGAVELSEPTLEPIPSLMAKAISFAQEHYAPDHPLVINLPPDTPAAAYVEVINDLGGGRPMEAGDESAFHVQTVRVRALTAEVELIYPRMGSVHELVTIRFRKKVLGEYKIDNTRLWRFEVQVPQAHYVTPEEAAADSDLNQTPDVEPDETEDRQAEPVYQELRYNEATGEYEAVPSNTPDVD